MYRKKMMVIATVFVAGLLGVMIWSSNVVAEHHKNMGNGPKVQEVSDQDLTAENVNDEQLEPENARGHSTAGIGTSIEERLQRPQVEEDDFVGLKVEEISIEPSVKTIVKPKKSVNDNYLFQMKDIKSLVLWNPNSFPLKVFIEDEQNLPAGFADSIKTGFTNWEKNSGNFVKFQYIPDKNQADIVVRVVAKVAGQCGEENGNQYGFNIEKTTLKNAYILISKTDCSGQPINVGKVYVALQHNLGHVLGLQGHSYDSYDTMYNDSSYSNINVSSRDTNTLKYLYLFAPDVTNVPYLPSEKAKMAHFSNIKNMVNQEEINDYLYEKIEDPSQVVTLSDKIFDEAMANYNKNNYQNAINKFQLALSKTQKTSEKAYMYNNISVLFLKLGDKQKGIKYAEYAYETSKEPTYEYLLAYANYSAGDTNKAMEYLDDILRYYPRLRVAYVLAAKIADENNDSTKLVEISKKAQDTFPYNPPVVYSPAVSEQQDGAIDESANSSEQND